MMQQDLEVYQRVQGIARETIDYLRQTIKSGMSESDICTLSNNFMIRRGIESFWYHGVGSLVLVGDRTTLSVSGRDYNPSSNVVASTDLVTVDLGPQIGTYWGDYARSLVVREGGVTNDRNKSSKLANELFRGIETEKRLHQILEEIARPNMTFEGLYYVMNQYINEFGYVNLDFKNNLGHSIEINKEDRIYIEEGCREKLSSRLFTFEPHIRREQRKYGFKREDIYYFQDGRLRKL